MNKHFLSSILLCVFFMSSAFSQSCEPPCRKGFTCVDGVCISDCVPACPPGYVCIHERCVSKCNPPCPAGSRCDPAIGDCIPDAAKKAPVYPRVARRSECDPGMLMIRKRCYYPDDLEYTGLGMFLTFTMLFGIGSSYSGMAGIIVSQVFWNEPYYSYDPYSYSSSSSGYYYSDAIFALAPQSAVFTSFGAVAQIPKMMQAKNLNYLGGTPSSGLIAAGWALYGFSIGTTVLNFASYPSDDKEFTTTTAIINASVLACSFGVHIAGYAVQAKRLETAVDNKLNEHSRKNIMFLPYAYCGNKRGGVGISLLF